MSVRKSFSIFVLIVVVSIAGILFFSIDTSTFGILKKAKPAFLGITVLLVVCGWMFDALKFIFLARAAGEKLKFTQVLGVVWINYFGSAITPMQSGGGPFQIYLLYKNGVSVGKSVAITLVRTFQIIFLLGIISLSSFSDAAGLLKRYKMIEWFLGYVLLCIGAAGVGFVISVLRPQWIKWLSSGFLVRIRRSGIIKPKRLIKVARWVNSEIDCYSVNIRLFLTEGRSWFLLSLVVAAAHLIVYMSIMPMLITAIGFEVNYMECIFAESLFLFLLYFVPTPGGSGAAEGGAAAVFSLFVPWNLAGTMAIAWRLLSEYTGIALGTIIAIKMLGWGGADEVMKEEENKLTDEDKC